MNDAAHETCHRYRCGAALLCILAVFLRGLIAPGMMPDPAAGRGEFKLVICSQSVLKTLDLATGDAPATDRDGDSGFCVFSASVHLATIADPPPFSGQKHQPVLMTAHRPSVAPAPLLGIPGARAPPRMA